MLNIFKSRLRQGYRTMGYPEKPAPALPARFAGRPLITPGKCPRGCEACLPVCPTNALSILPEKGMQLDLGKCVFCRQCVAACPQSLIRFSAGHQLASRDRDGLLVRDDAGAIAAAFQKRCADLFGRSLKLREVCAGGCNACEADTNVLGTIAWDLGRFGIQFVASPRHADGLLITGPVPVNMGLALQKTYDAVPDPKLVIAVGACAISGGLYAGNPEVQGIPANIPVDLYIPGCPPHPLTILDGLLRLLGKII
jgi:Ni,Fe-hydrogenase III small subunit/ferredoxin